MGNTTFKKNLLLFSYNCLPFLPIPPPHPSRTHHVDKIKGEGGGEEGGGFGGVG